MRRITAKFPEENSTAIQAVTDVAVLILTVTDSSVQLSIRDRSRQKSRSANGRFSKGKHESVMYIYNSNCQWRHVPSPFFASLSSLVRFSLELIASPLISFALHSLVVISLMFLVFRALLSPGLQLPWCKKAIGYCTCQVDGAGNVEHYFPFIGTLKMSYKLVGIQNTECLTSSDNDQLLPNTPLFRQTFMYF